MWCVSVSGRQTWKSGVWTGTLKSISSGRRTTTPSPCGGARRSAGIRQARAEEKEGGVGAGSSKISASSQQCVWAPGNDGHCEAGQATSGECWGIYDVPGQSGATHHTPRIPRGNGRFEGVIKCLGTAAGTAAIGKFNLEELHKMGKLLVGLVDRLLCAVARARSLEEVHLAAVLDLHLLTECSHACVSRHNPCKTGTNG